MALPLTASARRRQPRRPTVTFQGGQGTGSVTVGPRSTVGSPATFTAQGSTGPTPRPPRPPKPPAPPTPPAPTAPPPDPNYTNRVGIADQTLANTQSDYDYQQTGTVQHYGFDQGWTDEAGSYHPVTDDPFSVAHALDRNFKIAKNAATNSYAARGQFYSGAAQRAQDLAGYNHEHDLDTARRDYADANQGIVSGRARARTTRETSVADASSDATVAALLNRPSPDQVPQPKPKPTPKPKPASQRRRAPRRRGQPSITFSQPSGQGSGAITVGRRR